MRQLVQQLGHQLWSNNQDCGRDGYQFPAIFCGDGKPRPFVADVFFRTKEGAMVAIEVDFNHETTKVKVENLGAFGIPVIKAPPHYIDDWVKDPSWLQDEIKYAIKLLWKAAPVPVEI